MGGSDLHAAGAVVPSRGDDDVVPSALVPSCDAVAPPASDAGGTRAVRHARLASSLLLRLAAGAAAALVLALVAPLALGGRPLVVLSGSMEPTLHVGDVVVSQRIEPLRARPGDIVTFRDPDDAARLVTHRVRRVSVHGSKVAFVTRGDANNASERWEVGTDDEIGRSVLRVPKLGYALSLLHTPFGFAALVLVPLGFLLVLELMSIWKPDVADGEGHESG